MESPVPLNKALQEVMPWISVPVNDLLCCGPELVSVRNCKIYPSKVGDLSSNCNVRR